MYICECPCRYIYIHTISARYRKCGPAQCHKMCVRIIQITIDSLKQRRSEESFRNLYFSSNLHVKIDILKFHYNSHRFSVAHFQTIKPLQLQAFYLEITPADRATSIFKYHENVQSPEKGKKKQRNFKPHTAMTRISI